MKCREFGRVWNELLDARESASSELERELEAHASSCDSCRAIAVRFQTLRQVIRLSASAPPSPPSDFLDRFLEDPDRVRPSAPRLVRFRPMMRPLAVAATLLLVAVAGAGRWGFVGGKPVAAPVAKDVKAIDPDSLSKALAIAGSATWDLARETSGPAARVGREVFDSASFGPASLPLPMPEAPTAGVLQSVGDRVNAGVRPLSGTARHAFGFLLGSAPVSPPT